MSAEAKPATKLLMFGLRDGRYRKPEPAECSGIMKMSYLPGGRPLPAVVLGASPCGGGGGGASAIAEAPRVPSYVVAFRRRMARCDFQIAAKLQWAE